LIKRVVFFLLLIGAWLLWSGHWTLDGKHPLVAIFGLCSCLVVLLVSEAMDRAAGDEEDHNWGLRPLTYVPWLLWQIIKSNIEVARVILSPNMPISPRLVRVKSSQQSELGKVIYANSITLTPGTITLDVRGDDMLVHALTKDTAAGVKSGEMDRKVTALEGGSP